LIGRRSPVGRRSSALSRHWKGLPTVWRVVACFIVVVLGAFLGARFVTKDTSFSVSARTDVVSIETACAQQRLVWDLPPGKVGAAGAEVTALSAREVVSVALRGGARSRVRLGPNGALLIEFGPSASFDCGASSDAIVVTVDRKPLENNPDGYVYESGLAALAGPRPVLLLQGRVVLGEEIPFGAGTTGAVTAPLLHEARIEARTPDPLTLQRRLIHDETVDPGGMIDTHACLDQRADMLAACAASTRSSSQGFFHVVERDGRPSLQVQMHVTGERIGVRQQGGGERRIVVTWWSKLVTWSLLQIMATLLVFITTMTQIWSFFKRDAKGGVG
jgi:hypothetical protein